MLRPILILLFTVSNAFAVELLVVANSRHISLVLPVDAIPASFLPTDVEYTNYEQLDLSSGQDPYFYVKNPSLTSGIKAMLSKSPTLVRLHPFSGAPEVNYP